MKKWVRDNNFSGTVLHINPITMNKLMSGHCNSSHLNLLPESLLQYQPCAKALRFLLSRNLSPFVCQWIMFVLWSDLPKFYLFILVTGMLLKTLVDL